MKIGKHFLLRIFIKIRGLVFFLGFLIMPILFSAITLNIIEISNRHSNKSGVINALLNEKILLASLIMYAFFFIMFYILKKTKSSKINFINRENWFYSLGKALMPAIVSFGLALVIMTFTVSIINFLPLPEELKKYLVLPNKALTELMGDISHSSGYNIILWLTIIIIIAPVYEEILFRGFLQDFIKRFIKIKNLEIIIVALFFGLFHLPSFANVIYAFIIGIFLSIQRNKNKSVNVCIWMHSLINFAGVVLAIIYQYMLSRQNVN